MTVEVMPTAVRLNGARAEQGVIVTGKYTDGSRRDLTATATLSAAPTGILNLKKDESR